MSAATPYATIIVPIIDRHETLALSIPTALAQRRRDIEVFIACSGASRRVLELAHDFARRDNRVQVLDLPPSSLSTSKARAEAVKRARSDRLCILQDDDILFPNHIETMGALLDNSDFATTVTMAATLSGRVLAWPCTFGTPAYRELYRAGASKVLYEAHYAFRRSSYERLGVGWEHQTSSGGMSRRLLDMHVNHSDSVRWASATTPTALSLNSAPRTHMTNAQRADEMTAWTERIAAGVSADSLLARSTYAPMFGRHLQKDPPRPGTSLPQHLNRYGLRVRDQPSDGGALELVLSDRQYAALETLYQLYGHGKPDPAAVAVMVADMVEPFAGSGLQMSFLRLLVQIYGVPGATEIVSRAASAQTDAYSGSLLAAAIAWLRLRDSDVPGAVRYWQQAETLSGLAAKSASDIAVAVAIAEGRSGDAIKILESKIAAKRARASHYSKLVEIQLQHSPTQAVATLREGLAEFPEAKRLVVLAQKLLPDDQSIPRSNE
jgi:hypothetical protein